MQPLVAPLFFLIAGIVAGERLLFEGFLFCALGALSLVLPLFAFLSGRRFNAFHVAPLFFVVGALIITPHAWPRFPEDHIRNFVKKRGIYDIEAVVKSARTLSPRSTRLDVEPVSIFSGGRWQDTRGTVRLKIYGSSLRFVRGDRVRLTANLYRPRNFGNPGEFDYSGWLALRGIEVTGYVKEGAAFVTSPATGFFRIIDDARRGMERSIESSGVKYAGIMKALSTGDRSGIRKEDIEAYRRAGAAHILAISGLHMGIVAFFSFLLFNSLMRLSARLCLLMDVRKAAFLLTLPVVVSYGLVAGLSPPTVRALVMTVALIAGAAFYRPGSLYNALALAAVVILAASPWSIREASFQLSFVAVFFILYLYRPLRGLFLKREGRLPGPGDGLFIRRIKRHALEIFIVTVAATAGTYPVVAWHFYRVPTLGLLTNMAAIPLTTLAVPLVLSGSVLGALSATAGRLLLGAADMTLGLETGFVRLVSSIPFSSLWVARPTCIEIAAFYALIFSLVRFEKRAFRYVAAMLVVVLIAFPFSRHVRRIWSKDLKATFLSVGQGEATVVELPGGAVMLIDGGGLRSETFDTGEGIIAPFLARRGIGRIDYMVLSHAQRDHMKGLVFIVRNFRVGRFWWNGFGGLGDLGRALVKRGVPVEKAAGRTINEGGVRIEVYPTGERGLISINDASLVMMVTCGRRSFLFPGDIGERGEKILARGRVGLRATVLKSPHHGSSTSSSPGFLKAVRPSVIVISAGRFNPFGMPHGKTLDLYRKTGASIYRTDRDGAVEITTDGRALRVKTYGRGEKARLTHASP